VHRNGYAKMGCRMLLALRIPLNTTNGLVVQNQRYTNGVSRYTLLFRRTRGGSSWIRNMSE